MNDDELEKVVVEVWGDLACFTAPYGKVERLTWPFPTPSAARGILSAIYMKPVEFVWQVRRIEVLRPIQYISFKRNEFKNKADGKGPIFADDEGDKGRTQRQTVALKDVRYRIAAEIVPRPRSQGMETAFREQALRRIRMGKCYFQPGLGMREFVAYFGEPSDEPPIEDTLDAGLMVYDVFDFLRDDGRPKKKTTPRLSLYHAVMDHGVIQVPPYDSPEVLKGGPSC